MGVEGPGWTSFVMTGIVKRLQDYQEVADDETSLALRLAKIGRGLEGDLPLAARPPSGPPPLAVRARAPPPRRP